MRTLLAVLLSSSLAFGQAADAPLVDPPIKDLPAQGRVMELAAGEVVPFDATCLDKQQAKRAAKIETYYRHEATDLKAGNVVLPTAAFVAVIGSGAAAVITAIALGVALASKKP